MRRLLIATLGGMVLLAALIWGIYLRPVLPPARTTGSGHGPVPDFSHVVVVMMENQSPSRLTGPRLGYLRHLLHAAETDPDYFGVTHPSLPNYVAAISGRTGGTVSDNPEQRFTFPTLAGELNRRHLSWQAAMGGLPYPGYGGNWFPGSPKATSAPAGALYALKHDPFLLFPALRRQDANHVIPLGQWFREVNRGDLPRFTWISPNLCADMHGQPADGPRCPATKPALLKAEGDAFLHRLVPELLRSPAWNARSLLIVTWDETSAPASVFSPPAVRRYLAPGPAAPAVLSPIPAIPLGGGRVPFILIYGRHPRRRRIPLWADHYSILKTLEAGWHLPYLGHAADPSVPLLTPFFAPARPAS